MTITIVSRIFYPEPAAASLRLKALAEALQRSGEHVQVVTSRLPPDAADEALAGVTVRRAWVKRNRAGYVRGYLSYLSFDLPAAVRLLAARRPQGYVVEPPPTTGAIVRIVAAMRRRRYVYYAADVWSDAAEALAGSFVVRILRAVERWALNGAVLVLAVSPGVEKRLRELGVTSRIEVTGFGVDATVFVPRDVQPRELATFVYTGIYSERHGASVFSEALGLVLDERPNAARIDFYGTGSDHQQILDALPQRHAGALAFHAPVAPDEIARVMSGALAGLASVKPGLGYDYAFATKTLALLATGCPVVYAGPGPAAEVIRAAGSTVRAGHTVTFSAASVAHAMLDLIDQPLRLDERLALSRWTHRHHGEVAQADRVAQLVNGALSRSS